MIRQPQTLHLLHIVTSRLYDHSLQVLAYLPWLFVQSYHNRWLTGTSSCDDNNNHNDNKDTATYAEKDVPPLLFACLLLIVFLFWLFDFVLIDLFNFL